VVQILKKWGANADLQLGSGNTPTMAVVSGQEDAVAQGLSEMINAGLTIFGPNQPHVDYVMVSKKLKSVDELPGHTFGLGGTKNGIDAVLLHAVLTLHKIPFDKVQEIEIGTVANAVNAMIGGKLDAAFIHADTVKTAQAQGGLNVLATAAKDVAWSADSFMAAKPEYLKANPDLAVAMDEAYLAAAKIFNDDPKQWAAYAQEYTQHANSDQAITEAHDLFKTTNLWPADATAYSQDALQKNWDASNQMKDIKERGQRPISQWSDLTAWQTAVKAVLP
jgi:ABC-type nitrate/sulfonate/bicarbonate transport system substrate-binding protein